MLLFAEIVTNSEINTCIVIMKGGRQRCFNAAISSGFFKKKTIIS